MKEENSPSKPLEEMAADITLTREQSEALDRQILSMTETLVIYGLKELVGKRRRGERLTARERSFVAETLPIVVSRLRVNEDGSRPPAE